jgi:acyl-CoA thioesterase I
MIGYKTKVTPSRLSQVGMFGALVNAMMVAVFILAPGATVSADQTKPIKIVAFGDSLTAGFLLQPDQSFPAQLGTAAKARGLNIEVLNAGVSGDTTAAGLERFDWAVPEGTQAVILELGANDGLRGIEPAIARKNLETIITRLKARNIDILLAGMKAPKNWGDDYAAAFDSMYSELATAHGLLLYPFFLEGIALDPKLNLDDGLHPNPKGVAVIVDRIMPKVEELVARVTTKTNGTASKS